MLDIWVFGVVLGVGVLEALEVLLGVLPPPNWSMIWPTLPISVVATGQLGLSSMLDVGRLDLARSYQVICSYQ